MKRSTYTIALLIGLLGFSFNLSAQETEEAKTLFGNGGKIKKENLGFFVAPSFGYTEMGGSAGLLNVRGGLVIKDKWSLGAYFDVSVNEINLPNDLLLNSYMDYWSAGGFVEYTLFAKKVVHLTIPLYLGYGEIEMDNRNGNLNVGEANFFVIEPSALVEINLHKRVRLNLGAGYRLVSETNYRGLTQTDLSGVTGTVGIKFGLFR